MRLNTDDFEALKKEFPTDWQQRIENLSEYLASTGKTYHNHLATIRSWAKRTAAPTGTGPGTIRIDNRMTDLPSPF